MKKKFQKKVFSKQGYDIGVNYVYEMPWVPVCGLKAIQDKKGRIGLFGMIGGKHGLKVYISENGFKRKGDGYPDYYLYFQGATPRAKKGMFKETADMYSGKNHEDGQSITPKEYRDMVKRAIIDQEKENNAMMDKNNDDR